MAGTMMLYQYRPNIFTNTTADDRFVAMILATVSGCLAAIFIRKIQDKHKVYLFASLGILSTVAAEFLTP